MSTLVDGVVIVSKYKKTTFETLKTTKKSLEAINANILGVVLNQTDQHRKRYGNYYGNYYGSYYG